MGKVFVKFLRTNEIYHERKKTILIVHEWFTNCTLERTGINDRLFLFSKGLKKPIVFYWKDDFLEQTLKKHYLFFSSWTNERFNWTITSSEKTNEIDVKLPIILRTNKIIFFNN